VARGLGVFLLTVTLTLTGAQPRERVAFAQEAEMDAKGEAAAKEAVLLYKQGLYEDAAKLFAKLSLDYPDMLIFERNLGACFYYLKKPEPALSNLRHYLARKQDIAPDDKAVVDRWIDEMEKLRSQEVAREPAPIVPVPPEPVTEPPAPPPATFPEPVPAASPPIPSPPPPAPAGLDLSARAAPVEAVPFYKTWWFWTGATVVAAGGVTAVLLLTRRDESNIPRTSLGHQAGLP
jgi:tetratricopeptide (TPR) repeat protein